MTQQITTTGGPGQRDEHFDCIVVGAGHNGLATALVLARNGRRVLVLEKNDYVGGMGGTRDIFPGCRNEVGASCLFPLSAEVKAYFDFESHGVELIPLPVMAVNLVGADGRPLIFFKSQLRTSFNLLRQFGPGAMLGFARFLKFCQYPAQVLDRFTPRKAPRKLEDIIARAQTQAQREHLELAFRGSAMDIIDRFFPDRVKHRELRAAMAFAAVQATYKGPYSPGSGLCLIYTMAQEGSEGLMQRVKGGMGSLSESLARQIEALQGEVRLKQRVTRILTEGGRATGVELKNGERVYAPLVVSNLDKQATFNHLLAEHPLAMPDQARVDAFTHRGAFVHMLFRLKGLPRYSQHLERLNRIEGAHFGGAMVLDPEELQRSYETCLRGELPEQVPLAFHSERSISRTRGLSHRQRLRLLFPVRGGQSRARQTARPHGGKDYRPLVAAHAGFSRADCRSGDFLRRSLLQHARCYRGRLDARAVASRPDDRRALPGGRHRAHHAPSGLVPVRGLLSPRSRGDLPARLQLRA